MDEGPGEFDQHSMNDEIYDDVNTVACPGCGESVWTEAEKCPHCGDWFHGQAWEDQVAGGQAPRYWIWWVGAVLLIAMGYLLIKTGIPI